MSIHIFTRQSRPNASLIHSIHPNTFTPFTRIVATKYGSLRALQAKIPKKISKRVFLEHSSADPQNFLGTSGLENSDRATPKGTNLRGQTPICGFLQAPAVFCGFLRKSSQMLCSSGKGETLQKSAKICVWARFVTLRAPSSETPEMGAWVVESDLFLISRGQKSDQASLLFKGVLREPFGSWTCQIPLGPLGLHN